MAVISSNGILDEKRYNFLVPSDELSPMQSEESTNLRKYVDSLKSLYPFRVVEMAIEIQIERMRVTEAITARDAALQRLSDAYTSLHQKTEIIEKLKRNTENKESTTISTGITTITPELEATRAHICTLETTIASLRAEVRVLEEAASKYTAIQATPNRVYCDASTDTALLHPIQAPSDSTAAHTENLLNQEQPCLSASEESTDRVKARCAILATIPLPDNPPDDTLKPIIIPPPFTLHEFLSGASGSLRNSLASYRVLQSVTTFWCPEREEHGYFYTPMFKCNTNPRVATAHRWSVVDVTARMNKPTECFFNKEGLWYYAGSYKAFRLDELSSKEWAELSSETMQAIIKETISGRKNTSPQNVYETSQLYAAGALKVACVGLQCVGFNQDVYKAILDQAVKFTQTKWTALAAAGIPLPNPSVLASVVNATGGAVSTSKTSSPVIGRQITPTSSPGLLSSSILSPVISCSVGLGTGSPTWNASAAASPIIGKPVDYAAAANTNKNENSTEGHATNAAMKAKIIKRKPSFSKGFPV